MSDKAEVLEQVLDRYDVKYNPTRTGEQTISCPNRDMHAHDDRNPSARINLTKGLFYCMGCGLKGDGYNILMEIDHIDFVAATEQLGKPRVEIESDWLL